MPDIYDRQDMGLLRRRIRKAGETFLRERELYLSLVHQFLEVGAAAYLHGPCRWVALQLHGGAETCRVRTVVWQSASHQAIWHSTAVKFAATEGSVGVPCSLQTPAQLLPATPMPH